MRTLKKVTVISEVTYEIRENNPKSESPYDWTSKDKESEMFFATIEAAERNAKQELGVMY